MNRDEAMSFEQLQAAIQVLDDEESFKRIAQIIGHHRGMGFLTDAQTDELVDMVAKRYDEVKPRGKKIDFTALAAFARAAIRHMTDDEIRAAFVDGQRLGVKIGAGAPGLVLGLARGSVGGTLVMVEVLTEPLVKGVRKLFGK